MKKLQNDMFLYARLIVRKWVLWVFATLDLGALVTQVLFPAFRVPQVLYVLITLVGLFWAGYQVYRDLVGQLPNRPVEPPPYELIPLSFEVWLHQDIPNIGVYLYIVNYQPRELVLHSLTLTSLRLPGCPDLENIPLSHEIRVPPKRSEQVWCRRNLIDAEARAIERASPGNPASATLSATAQAIAGQKHLHYELSSRSIAGWLR